MNGEALVKFLPPCIICGQPAPFICDFETAPGRTCDATLCGKCGWHTGVKDYCPEHAAIEAHKIPVAVRRQRFNPEAPR